MYSQGATRWWATMLESLYQYYDYDVWQRQGIGAAECVGPASVNAGLVLAGFWREKRTRVVITTGGAQTRRFLRVQGALSHPELDDEPARRRRRANWFRRRRAALRLLRGARVCGADFAAGDGG